MLEDFQDLIEDFQKDPIKESKGVWMTFKRHKYLIARAHRNNTEFQKVMETEMRPYQWAIDRGNYAAIKEVANDALQIVYARTVLRGVQKLDGTMLAYTPDIGIELFKKLPDLWDEIFKFAGNDGNYTPDQIELDAKN